MPLPLSERIFSSKTPLARKIQTDSILQEKEQKYSEFRNLEISLLLLMLEAKSLESKWSAPQKIQILV